MNIRAELEERKINVAVLDTTHYTQETLTGTANSTNKPIPIGEDLSGHTHNGQLWPFNYLVRLRYTLLGGRYEVGGMPVIVCRGTGTWGPRMRLWQPAEIVRIKLIASRS